MEEHELHNHIATETSKSIIDAVERSGRSSGMAIVIVESIVVACVGVIAQSQWRPVLDLIYERAKERLERKCSQEHWQ